MSKQGVSLTGVDESRRRFLARALSLGLFAGGAGWNLPALAALFGKIPGKLPAGRSIFDLRGDVRINGQVATAASVIGAADKLTVGSNSYVIAAVGDSAFILRENSALELAGAGKLVVRSMRLVTGALLSVFGRRDAAGSIALRTPTATIGIRGTGVYAEADPQKTYLCTCYGTTDLAAVRESAAPAAKVKGKAAEPPLEKATITALHHDAPKYILAEPDNGKRITAAPFINHTDMELMTIEALVGRTVPFGLESDQYDAPRRDY